jgi:hypothetical protein
VVEHNVPRRQDVPARCENMRTTITGEIDVPNVAEITWPGVGGALFWVDRCIRGILPTPPSVRVGGTAQELDEVGDEEGGDLRGLLGEVRFDHIDVTSPPLSKPVTKVVGVISSQVVGVGGFATYVVRDYQILNNLTFKVLLIQVRERGNAIPVEEARAQELHQLELGVVAKHGAGPVGGSTEIIPEGAIQVPREVMLARQPVEIDLPQRDQDVEHPRVTQRLPKTNGCEWGT